MGTKINVFFDTSAVMSFVSEEVDRPKGMDFYICEEVLSEVLQGALKIERDNHKLRSGFRRRINALYNWKTKIIENWKDSIKNEVSKKSAPSHKIIEDKYTKSHLTGLLNNKKPEFLRQHISSLRAKI